ncbi:MAG: 5-deoxy-glucuronate isomerase [Spirochaetales bacterium]|nr:5-deoxy-glucuronate isomerase [Spirochaetales bacterium]
MVLHKTEPYTTGLNMIVSQAEDEAGMRLDFGILNLLPGMSWEDKANKERALLLLSGTVRFSWNGQERMASRNSCFDENPEVLLVPAGMDIQLTAGDEGAKLVYEACLNHQSFEPVYYGKENVREDVFGAGVMGEASIRTVRTIFDGEIAPFSNMVLGEVVNHPGKWSSYPPHDHPHPEIYHYTLFPSQGFGVSLLDEEATVVKDGSTSLIPPDTTHSQVAGAGYAMHYVWMIPHLPNDRWLPSTRYFRKEHEWLMEPNVKIWPERPYSKENA